jgi:hypothetical protein
LRGVRDAGIGGQRVDERRAAADVDLGPVIDAAASSSPRLPAVSSRFDPNSNCGR